MISSLIVRNRTKIHESIIVRNRTFVKGGDGTSWKDIKKGREMITIHKDNSGEQIYNVK